MEDTAIRIEYVKSLLGAWAKPTAGILPLVQEHLQPVLASPESARTVTRQLAEETFPAAPGTAHAQLDCILAVMQLSSAAFAPDPAPTADADPSPLPAPDEQIAGLRGFLERLSLAAPGIDAHPFADDALRRAADAAPQRLGPDPAAAALAEIWAHVSHENVRAVAEALHSPGIDDPSEESSGQPLSQEPVSSLPYVVLVCKTLAGSSEGSQGVEVGSSGTSNAWQFQEYQRCRDYFEHMSAAELLAVVEHLACSAPAPLGLGSVAPALPGPLRVEMISDATVVLEHAGLDSSADVLHRLQLLRSGTLEDISSLAAFA